MFKFRCRPDNMGRIGWEDFETIQEAPDERTAAVLAAEAACRANSIYEDRTVWVEGRTGGWQSWQVDCVPVTDYRFDAYRTGKAATAISAVPG